MIEAVIEDLEAKQRVFARADTLTPASTILATNTSSLSVSRIAAATARAALTTGGCDPAPAAFSPGVGFFAPGYFPFTSNVPPRVCPVSE